MSIKEELYYIPPLSWLSDELYCKLHYRKTTGRKLNLKNPQTFMEKTNWLKLYDHNPFYNTLVDKAEVKKYVAGIIGDEYIIPTYGVFDSFEEIDFDSLPDQFVLKCTHDSGGLVICRDKSTFDKTAAKKKLKKHLRRKYYLQSREWPYKDVKPRIIAEKYVDGLMVENALEYKVTCCNGEIGFYTICTGIAHTFEERKNDFYDEAGNHQPYHTTYNDNAKERPVIPPQMGEILELSKKLCGTIPHIRVDWYIHDGKPLFGELTLYSWGGFFNWNEYKYDVELGKKIKLPIEK